MKKKKGKFIYAQDWGTYQQDTVVAVNCTKDDIVKWCEKNTTKNFLAIFNKKEQEGLGEMTKEGGASGCVWYQDGYSILWIRDYENSFRFYDTLVHECLHLVQFGLIEHRSFQGENEGQAYQQEFLHRSIRRRLSSHYAKK